MFLPSGLFLTNRNGLMLLSILPSSSLVLQSGAVVMVLNTLTKVGEHVIPGLLKRAKRVYYDLQATERKQFCRSSSLSVSQEGRAKGTYTLYSSSVVSTLSTTPSPYTPNTSREKGRQTCTGISFLFLSHAFYNCRRHSWVSDSWCSSLSGGCGIGHKRKSINTRDRSCP